MSDTRSLVEKLNSLRALHVEGTLTDAEHEAARARVIAEHTGRPAADDVGEGWTADDFGPAPQDASWDPRDLHGGAADPGVGAGPPASGGLDLDTLDVPDPPAVPSPAPGTDPAWQPFTVPDGPPDATRSTTPDAPSPDPGLAPFAPAPPADPTARTSSSQSRGARLRALVGSRGRVAVVAAVVALALVSAWLVAGGDRRPTAPFSGGAAAQPVVESARLASHPLALPSAVWGTPRLSWETEIALPVDVDLPDEVRIISAAADDAHVAVVLEYGGRGEGDSDPAAPPEVLPVQLVVLGRADGRIRWASDIREVGTLDQVHVADGVVVTVLPDSGGPAAPGPHLLVGLDAEDGSVRWEQEVARQATLVPHPRHGLMAVTGEGLLVLDAQEGVVRTHEATSVWVSLDHAALVDELDDRTLDVRVIALATGEETARTDVEVDGRSSAALTQVGVAGELLAVAQGEEVRVLDLDGREVDRIPLAEGPATTVAGTGQHLVLSSPEQVLVYDVDEQAVVHEDDVALTSITAMGDLLILDAGDRITFAPSGDRGPRDASPFAAGQLLVQTAGDGPGDPAQAVTLDGEEAWALPAGADDAPRWAVHPVEGGILLGLGDRISLHE